MVIAILLIIITVLSRLLPHIPNFSPLVAVALFSGVYLNKRYSFLIPLVIYIVSDIIIGLHNTVFFTWSTIILIYFLGHYLSKRKTVFNIISYTLLSSIIFFVVTNFGVWLVGWYPRTLEGLIKCFTLAIPFFRTSLLADLTYVGLLFGVYEILVRKSRLPLKQPLS